MAYIWDEPDITVVQKPEQPMVFQDEFELLLARIREGRHPDYGTLVWNGEQRAFSITVVFECEDEADEVVRERAVRYLESLTKEERRLVNIDVAFREGRPVRATLRTGTGILSSERLRELSNAIAK